MKSLLVTTCRIYSYNDSILCTETGFIVIKQFVVIIHNNLIINK